MSRAPRLARLAVVLLLGFWPQTLRAGGGPENVLLVVNPNSQASMTIANHYLALRSIPMQNVLYLPWDPKLEKTDINTFRREILVPVLAAAVASGAPRRIDYVVYSSDYPWAIDTSPDVTRYLDRRKLQPARPADSVSAPDDNAHRARADSRQGPDFPKARAPEPWPKQATQVGSINGLTFLWQLVLSGDPTYYMSMDANRYARQATRAGEVASSGFRSTHLFDVDGDEVDATVAEEAYRDLLDLLFPRQVPRIPRRPIELPGTGYLLSTMLGVTTENGNSVPEILEYLQRSAEADETHPGGTIYYMKNENVRSRVRHDLFPAAVENLARAGVAAEIVEGTVPQDRNDVQGVTIGAAIVDWAGSGSRIQPGAICEHLTSFGGVMSPRHNQTPLSEFLRHGAAGASGTVTEPYAIQAKFPLAWLHVHYARGCSLAEAFYQSVSAPYQLLIVGDPLCRPWANLPSVEVQGIEPGGAVEGVVDLTPSAVFPGTARVHHYELFVDGVAAAVCAPGGSFRLDTAGMCDGCHEIRIVAVEDSPVRSQGACTVPFRTVNHDRAITLSGPSENVLRADSTLQLHCSSPGSIGIVVMQNTRTLATISGEAGQVRVDLSQAGLGPVSFYAIGLGRGGPETNVISELKCYVIQP